MSEFEELVDQEKQWKRACPLKELEFWYLFKLMLSAKWLEDPPKEDVK